MKTQVLMILATLNLSAEASALATEALKTPTAMFFAQAKTEANQALIAAQTELSTAQATLEHEQGVLKQLQLAGSGAVGEIELKQAQTSVATWTMKVSASQAKIERRNLESEIYGLQLKYSQGESIDTARLSGLYESLNTAMMSELVSTRNALQAEASLTSDLVSRASVALSQGAMSQKEYDSLGARDFLAHQSLKETERKIQVLQIDSQ